MIVQEVRITIEQELVGSTPKVTVQHRGIAHPVGVIALCNKAIRHILVQMQQDVIVPQAVKQ